MLRNDLTLIKRDSKYYINSREAAEIIDKRHDHLLRDIENYIGIMENSIAPKIGVNEFFVKSTYIDSIGRTLPCYLITKKGAEMIANKLTGEKGVIFTALYVNKFNELEQRERTLPAAKIPQLKDYNDAARIVTDTLKEANVPAHRIALTVKQIYGLGGIPISMKGVVNKHIYSASEIAQICGMKSINDKPHYHAVRAIILMLDIDAKHSVFLPYFYGNDIRISICYDEFVLDAVTEWVFTHNFPEKIQSGSKKYTVVYEDWQYNSKCWE